MSMRIEVPTITPIDILVLAPQLGFYKLSPLAMRPDWEGEVVILVRKSGKPPLNALVMNWHWISDTHLPSNIYKQTLSSDWRSLWRCLKVSLVIYKGFIGTPEQTVINFDPPGTLGPQGCFRQPWEKARHVKGKKVMIRPLGTSCTSFTLWPTTQEFCSQPWLPHTHILSV